MIKNNSRIALCFIFSTSGLSSLSYLFPPLALRSFALQRKMNNKIGKKTTADSAKNAQKDEGGQHFHCYLLRSLDPLHPNLSYIGYTTNPYRRLRQHNGCLKSGGARRTRRKGRPWEFVTIISGFTTSKQALQFEWHWQHPAKSKTIRLELGDDQASKLQRQRDKMNALVVLLLKCEPFCSLNLVLHFFSHNQDVGKNKFEKALATSLPAINKSGDSTARDASTLLLSHGMVCKVIHTVQDMPFWQEIISVKTKRTRKKPALGSDKTATGNQTLWDYFFSLLCEYEEQHGNCNDSLLYPMDPDLVDWMQRQRLQYHRLHSSTTMKGDYDPNKKFITDEQMDALESIGFDWKITGNVVTTIPVSNEFQLSSGCISDDEGSKLSNEVHVVWSDDETISLIESFQDKCKLISNNSEEVKETTICDLSSDDSICSGTGHQICNKLASKDSKVISHSTLLLQQERHNANVPRLPSPSYTAPAPEENSISVICLYSSDDEVSNKFQVIDLCSTSSNSSG